MGSWQVQVAAIAVCAVVLAAALVWWLREYRRGYTAPAVDAVDKHFEQTPAAPQRVHAGTWDFDPAGWRADR